jgi:hypothetical protein
MASKKAIYIPIIDTWVMSLEYHFTLPAVGYDASAHLAINWKLVWNHLKVNAAPGEIV